MRLLVDLVLLGLLAVSRSANSLETRGRHLTAQCPPLSQFDALEPTVTHAPVVDVEWVGANDQTVFAITRKYQQKDGSLAGGFWKSTNAGKQFTDLTAKLNATAGATESFTILQLHSQQNKVLLIGSGSYNWVSTDSGDGFTAVLNNGGWKGRDIRDIRRHPRAERDSWFLMMVPRPSCKTKDRAIGCPNDLLLNKNVFDAMSPWVNLTANANGKIVGFADFDWGANLCPSRNCSDLPDISDDLIFATVYYATGDGSSKEVSFVSSTDLFASSSARVQCGNQFEVVGRSLYLAMSNTCPNEPDGSPRATSLYPDGITLYTSMDAGRSFTQTCLPMAPDQTGYQLMVTHDGRGAVVVVQYAISAGFDEVIASSVYTAGPHHALYALSLTNVFNPYAEFGGDADFVRVSGVPGVYIANQLLPFAPGNPASQLPGSGGNPDMNYYYDGIYDYDMYDMMGTPLVETRITFNGGGRWQRILAPQEFPHSKCDLCKGKTPCYLHLHSISDWDSRVPLPAIYSNPAAPGIIMASGNVAPLGEGLDKNAGLCTFLSTDAGVTWTEVGEGAYIYEFADWGGIIVMARHPGETVSGPGAVAEEVLFSLDYGNCWQPVKLNVPLLVDNIVIEPDGQQAQVIIHGRACKNSTDSKCMRADVTNTSGLIYMLDLKAKMTDDGLGQCGGADFEMWTIPVSPKNTTARCVLGQQYTFTRRKQGSRCYQGAEYKRPASQTKPCPCTKEQDTECEYGYIRNNDTCMAIDKEDMPQCPVISSGTYTVSSTHRRLVHGDVCLNPENIMPDTGGTGQRIDNAGGGTGGGGGGGGGGGSQGGKAKSHGGGWIGFLIVMLVLAALGALFAGWWHYRASEDQQETVRELAGSAAAHVSAAWWLVVDKCRDLVDRIRNRGGSSGNAGHGGEEMGYFQPLGDPGYDVAGRGNVFTLK